NILPVCLEGSAAALAHAGQISAATALIQESNSISEATGNAPLRYTSLVLAAWRGDQTRTTSLIEARLRDAQANGEGRVVGLAKWVTSVLYHDLGRYEEALAAARGAGETADLRLTGLALTRLIQAGARAGTHGLSGD